MQTNTESATIAIDEVTTLIEEVNSISQTIVSTVEKQSAAMSEIAGNVSSLSDGSREVASNVADSAQKLSSIDDIITKVNNSAEETSTSIVQVKERTNDQANLTDSLKLLSRFTFHTRSRPTPNR